MSNRPLVSVVMSVYNGEKYLRQSIDSILTQSYTDFEFIIIDDGSSDNSLKIIQSYDDARIKIITHENRGLIAALNEGITMSRGIYIARQDDDDISLPHRLKAQVAYIQNSPEISIVGSSFIMMDESGKTLTIFGVPTDNTDITRELFIRNPLAHGSILASKKMLTELGGYPLNVGPIEDYELWAMFYLAGAKFTAIPEVLYKWRYNTQGISFSKSKEQEELVEKLKNKLWANYLPTKETMTSILQRHNKYRALAPEVAGYISIRFVIDQFELGNAYLGHGSLSNALRQWAIFAFLFPTNFKVAYRGTRSLASRTYHQTRSIFGRLIRRIGLLTR